MKSKILMVGALLYVCNILVAQNVGIATNNPRTTLDVAGNLHVRKEYFAARNPETAADRITLINNSTIAMAANDSLVRIFDPGGPNGNYLPNLTATYRIADNNNTLNSTALELSFDEVDLNTGEVLYVYKFGGNPYEIVSFNDSFDNTTNKKIVVPLGVDIVFVSNSDGLVGRGFNIGVKKLFEVKNNNSQVYSSALPGVVAQEYGGLSVGTNNNTFPNFSYDTGIMAIGSGNISNGNASLVVGELNNTDSPNSHVLGSQNFMETDEGDDGGSNTIIGNQNTIQQGFSNFLVGNNNSVDNESNNLVLGFSNEVTTGNTTFLGSNLQNAIPGNIVLGRYNEFIAGMSDFTTPTNPIFVLGSGTESARQNAMVTLRNGHTGMGVNSPLARMHVREKIIADQPAATGLASLEFRSNNAYRGALGYDQGNGRFFFFDGESGQNTFFINNGRMGILRDPTTNALEVAGNASKSSAGDWLANSDARLKKSIQPITGALSKISQLQGITYHWNDTKTGIKRPEGLQYGFTAQNIQGVFPELVENDAQGYLQTAYGTYDAMLVEAIKELLQKVQVLEQKIKNLENFKTNK